MPFYSEIFSQLDGTKPERSFEYFKYTKEKAGRGSSVGCASADGRGFDPHVRQHSFVGIGHEIIYSMISKLVDTVNQMSTLNDIIVPDKSTVLPYKSIRDQIWLCRKICQNQPRVIIWTNLVVLERLMLHTKFLLVPEKRIFTVLPYMDMAAILVMSPGLFE